MNKNKFIATLFPERLRMFLYTQFTIFYRTTNRKNYAKAGTEVDLFGPLNLDPKQVFLDDFVRLQPGIRIISANGRVFIKKFTAVGAGTVIIPGAHIPTVGLPQYLSLTHINDTNSDIIINEDCWIGAGAYLLSHAKIGRGAIVAANSVVTKEIPPYAVVAGAPAKVIASRFSAEQILEHERILYPAEERMSNEDVEKLFKDHFENKKSIGTNKISPEDLDRLNKAKLEKGISIYE